MNPVVIRAILPVLAVLAAACSPSQSSKHDAKPVDTAPSAHIVVCHGHDCTYRDRLPVTRNDAQRFASIMAAGRGSAQAERAAIGKAIQHFELRTSAYLGHRDTPMSQFRNAGVKGEMDCIDEAMNSRALLRYLAGRGLLRHHTVGENASRGFMIDGQFPHAAATIREKNGTQWAVDSWEGAPGDAPIIIPLAKWRVSGDLGRELGAAF